MFSHIELGYLSGNKRALCHFTGTKKDQFTADLEIDGAGLRLGRRFFVDLKTPAAVELLHFKIELKPSLAESKRMMVNGFQSWSSSGEMSPAHRLPRLFLPAYPFLGPYGDYRLHRYSGRRGHLHSWTYTYFITGEGEIFLLGSLDEGAGYTLFDYDYRRDRLIISRDCEGALCKKSYPLLRLYLGRGKPRAVMDEYFKAMGLPQKRSPRVTGWCSWYNYYTHVTGDDIEHNLEELSALGLPFDYLQIDDGWQQAIGDWLEPNAKFPSGMKKVADRISARGFQPGLWLAPLICERRSQLFREKKEWLLRDSRGRPVKAGYNPGWSGWFYALDFYAPGFQDYLRRVFQRLRDEWGYRLFKLDFLFAAALLPRRGRSRGAVMTEVMEFLRKQAGESKLLGCGVPLGPAMGRVDYCRIGADVYESWDLPLKGFSIRERLSTGNSLLSTIGRHHLDGRAFRNDPDVFFLRDGLPGKNLNRLTHHQRGSLFFLNQLFGGLVFFSDDPAEYTAEQRQQLRSAFPAVEALIDSVENQDGFYRIEFTARRRRYLALANLTGRPRDAALDGGPYFHPRHFVLPRGATLALDPYETLCLYAIEPGEEKPYLLGATGHIYPGAQIEKLILRRNSVTLRLHEQSREDSRIFLAVPRDMVSLRVNGIEHPITLKEGIHFATVGPLR
jgi:alpha-galactosidase